MSTFTIDTSTSRATPSPVPGKRTTAPSIRGRKVGGKTEQPIVMLTAYTMRMAQLLDPHCDMLLVGDSLGQVIYGLPSTIPVTLEMMCAHGAAVVRGSWHALVAVDMPFGSYEASPQQAFQSASRIMKETGCAAVKLEGGEAMAPTVMVTSAGAFLDSTLDRLGEALMLVGIAGYYVSTLVELSLDPALVASQISRGLEPRTWAVVALTAILIALTWWRTRSGFFHHALAFNGVVMACGFLLVGYQLSGYFLSVV